MIGHFDTLLESSASDGASAISTAPWNRHPDEIDHLMEAWYQERSERIELELFLSQARQLLDRAFREGKLTRRWKRQARGLLLAIDEADRVHRGRDA